MYIKIWLIAFFLIFVGCQNFRPKQAQDIAIGAAGAKAIDTFRNQLAPHYPLYLGAFELCYVSHFQNFDILLEDVLVKCFLTPCDTKCEQELSWKDFVKKSPRFISLQSGSELLSTQMQFCKKQDKKMCIEQFYTFLSYIQGKYILVKK